MVFAAARFRRHDALEYGSDNARGDTQAGFFKDFARDGFFKTLTRLNQATGQRPTANKGRLATFDKKNLTIPKDERSYAKQRARRKTTAFALSCLSQWPPKPLPRGRRL